MNASGLPIETAQDALDECSDAEVVFVVSLQALHKDAIAKVVYAREREAVRPRPKGH